ncbi:OmpA family protein [Burkholderia sp. WSM2230]|uniref:OmpA family protein n=1 Tax=Burkholderia sp. WSM2230 TaxID=944435 RepID=UPI00040ACB2B|nr:OmpA family protein [Burkholderia sp. WSM2230]
MEPRLTGYPSGYPYRTLFVWVALLALVWLALSSPWSAGWNAIFAALVIFSALVAVVLVTKRARARRQATRHVLDAADTALGSLPAELKHNTPLVIAVGDSGGKLDELFGSGLVRITDSVIWVRNEDPTRLMYLADALKRWRDGQGPDAIAYLLAADEATGAVTLQASLRRWCSAIGEASRAVGYALPVCVALYAREKGSSQEDAPWFGVSGAEGMQPDALADLIAARLAQYTHMASPEIPEERELRAHRAARLDAIVRWATHTIVPVFVNAQRGALQLAALGVTAIDGRPAADSLFGQFVTGITELPLASADGGAQRASAAHTQATRSLQSGTPQPRTLQPRTPPYYPLPEPLIRGIQAQSVRRALPRALAHAFVWLTAGFCAAAAASAWQNRALVERVVGDMARYKAIAPAEDAARVDALKAVKRDRDELERYGSLGVPPRLGLGLYRGAPLLQPLNALIASYQPPPPAPIPPPTIELDSMSLFRSGSAVLNPGSNRVLIGALEMIKAHPDKRVLVAGHTDSVGAAASNLKLSEARAASVRNWLADASGIAPTRFAIQGYGDTRPKAPNTTEAGRAANRRVEITLVPDCRDTFEESRNGNSRSIPQGHTACSLE